MGNIREQNLSADSVLGSLHEPIQPERVSIRPVSGWAPLNFGDLWAYRELLYFLAWRDIKVRYKQTVLGIAWALLQPFMIMVVFSVFFGRLAGVPSEGVPYPIFAFAALLPWQVFAHALNESSNSLIANEKLITKVYFPRLIIPLASVLGGLIDFGASLCFLLLMMAYYGIAPTADVWILPFFIILALTTALAVGLWLSAFNVQYRDVRYTLPFLTQFWLFMSPVAYSSSLVPEPWRVLYGMNPMVGIIDGFRWALLGTGEGPGMLLAVSAAVVALLLVGGLYYFRRVEKTFADVV